MGWGILTEHVPGFQDLQVINNGNYIMNTVANATM